MAVVAALPLPELYTDTRVASAGFYRLEWRLPGASDDENLQYELQESRDDRFADAVPRYRGPDFATVMSGLSDGVRYYRVRAVRDGQPVSAWSETLSVETRHHSLPRALIFFISGAIVFVLTLILVLRGAGEYSRDQA